MHIDWKPKQLWTIKSVPDLGWMAVCETDQSSACAASLYDLGILIKAIDCEIQQIQQIQQMQLLPQANPDAP
jgi:hypothetical protein